MCVCVQLSLQILYICILLVYLLYSIPVIAAYVFYFIFIADSNFRILLLEVVKKIRVATITKKENFSTFTTYCIRHRVR